MKKLGVLLLSCFVFSAVFGQPTPDSIHLDYRKIYSLCLDANVRPALVYIQATDQDRLSATDRLFKSTLSLVDSTLHHLIKFFIANGNYDSENGHSIANYCAIRDLSILLFHKNYESDPEAWKQFSVSQIHEAALKILGDNTNALLQLGGKSGDVIFVKQIGR